MTTTVGTKTQTVALEALSEARLGALRLREPAQLRQLSRSLVRYGQLEPVVAYAEGEQLELIDGFKRAAVARQLRWDSLRVQIAAVDSTQATVLLAELAERAALSALEQGWLVQALHRKEGLSQGEIAAQLGRHKSWVCRRLLLVEQLDPAVQHDIQLGLLAPRAAVALVALPRGNQQQAAQIAAKGGLTVKQTERFVAELSSCTGVEQTDAVLRAWSEGARPARDTDSSERRPSSGADRLMADIAAMRAVCARLHGRMMAVPLSGLVPEAALLVTQQLRELAAVMGSVRQGIAQAVQIAKEGDV